MFPAMEQMRDVVSLWQSIAVWQGAKLASLSTDGRVQTSSHLDEREIAARPQVGANIDDGKVRVVQLGLSEDLCRGKKCERNDGQQWTTDDTRLAKELMCQLEKEKAAHKRTKHRLQQVSAQLTEALSYGHELAQQLEHSRREHQRQMSAVKFHLRQEESKQELLYHRLRDAEDTLTERQDLLAASGKHLEQLRSKLLEQSRQQRQRNEEEHLERAQNAYLECALQPDTHMYCKK